MRVIIDPNVIYAGLYSSKGASYQVLKDFRNGLLNAALSIALYEEYSDVLGRPPLADIFGEDEVEEFLGFFCRRSTLIEVFYLWRPFLNDPKDDLVLEAAVAFGAEAILTHNKKDFTGSEKLGVTILSPKEYLTRKKDL